MCTWDWLCSVFASVWSPLCVSYTIVCVYVVEMSHGKAQFNAHKHIAECFRKLISIYCGVIQFDRSIHLHRTNSFRWQRHHVNIIGTTSLLLWSCWLDFKAVYVEKRWFLFSSSRFPISWPCLSVKSIVNIDVHRLKTYQIHAKSAALMIAQNLWKIEKGRKNVNKSIRSHVLEAIFILIIVVEGRRYSSVLIIIHKS